MFYILWGVLIIAVLLIISMVTAIIPALILRLLGMRRAADALVFWHVAILSDIGLFLAGTRVHVSGDVKYIRECAKKGEGFCFIANHTSMLDIILLFGKLRGRTGFVAKKSLAFIPFLNILIAMTHSVFIDRKSLRKSVEAIRKATQNIKDGFPMAIFPEGTRSKTGEVGTFKHGAFRMATESGARVVPLTIKGIRSSFEERRHIFQVRHCYLDVGKPVVPPRSSDREAVARFVAETENSIKTTYASLGNK